MIDIQSMSTMNGNLPFVCPCIVLKILLLPQGAAKRALHVLQDQFEDGESIRAVVGQCESKLKAAAQVRPEGRAGRGSTTE